MDVLKKHYEKILLSFVLLVLAGTAVWLFIAIEKKREEISVTIPPLDQGPKIKPMELGEYQKALDRLRTPPDVDFGLPHHVYNSVVWKQAGDGRLIKLVSIDMPRVTSIRPLHFTITFEKAADTGGYQFKVTTEITRTKRPETKSAYLKEGEKTQLGFKLEAVEGPKDNPTALRLELNDSQQKIVVSPGQPFKRVDGYAAEMRYEVDKKDFKDVRVGEGISFGGETYKVVAITENAVTVQANSNLKQTTIKWKMAP